MRRRSLRRKDEYREQLQAMIAKKLEQAGTTPAGEPAVAAKPIVDILEALKKSIAMAREPAASETPLAREDARQSHGDQAQGAVSQGAIGFGAGASAASGAI